MKSLPRLALGAFFAGMLAVSSYATTQTCTSARYVGPTGGFVESWNIAVPSTVDIAVSFVITISYGGGGGGSAVYRNGTYVTGAGVSNAGVGTTSRSNSAYAQPAGNYVVNHTAAGSHNPYVNINTTLTW